MCAVSLMDKLVALAPIRPCRDQPCEKGVHLNQRPVVHDSGGASFEKA